MKDYYSKMYGAKSIRGASDSLSLPGGNLVFSRSATPTKAPTGTSLDHIGFDISGSHDGLASFSKAIEAKGTKFSSPYRRSEFGNARPKDPFGVVIELTHGQGGYFNYKQIEAEVLPCEKRPITPPCW